MAESEVAALNPTEKRHKRSEALIPASAGVLLGMLIVNTFRDFANKRRMSRRELLFMGSTDSEKDKSFNNLTRGNQNR